jgi:hypothetical protein
VFVARARCQWKPHAREFRNSGEVGPAAAFHPPRSARWCVALVEGDTRSTSAGK